MELHLGNNISINTIKLLNEELKRNDDPELREEKNKKIKLKNIGLVTFTSLLDLNFTHLFFKS